MLNVFQATVALVVHSKRLHVYFLFRFRCQWVEEYLTEKGLRDRVKILRIYNMSRMRAAAHHTCHLASVSIENFLYYYSFHVFFLLCYLLILVMPNKRW